MQRTARTIIALLGVPPLGAGKCDGSLPISKNRWYCDRDLHSCNVLRSPAIDHCALDEMQALTNYRLGQHCRRRTERGDAIMLFLVVSTPRPERPSDLVGSRQSFWPWIAAYQARGLCRHIYARAGRGAVAVFDVEDNDALHRILNEWADIIPAHFDTYPLIEADAAKRMLAAQAAAPRG